MKDHTLITPWMWGFIHFWTIMAMAWVSNNVPSFSGLGGLIVIYGVASFIHFMVKCSYYYEW